MNPQNLLTEIQTYFQVKDSQIDESPYGSTLRIMTESREIADSITAHVKQFFPFSVSPVQKYKYFTFSISL